MPAFSFTGQILSGLEPFDWGVSALLSVEHEGGRFLLVASGQDGGVAAYSLASGSTLPTLSDTHEIDLPVNTGTGRPLGAAMGPDGLWIIAGQTSLASPTLLSLDGNGSLSAHGGVSGPSSGASWFLQAGNSLVSGQLGADAATLYDWSATGTASGANALHDSTGTHLDGLSALATAEFGGQTLLFTASSEESGLSAFALNGNSAAHLGSVSAASGIGLMTPTDIEFVALDGQGFVLLTTAASHGSSGTLTVLQISATGGLSPVDHVLDTQDTRFGAAQAVEAVLFDGQAFVVVAGGDGGLSLFQLAPTGQLVHLHSFEGTAQTPLLGLTDLALSLSGSSLQVFASTGADAGIAMFTVDLGGRGVSETSGAAGGTLSGSAQHDLLTGRAGDDRLLGQNGNDILISGGGADTLSGGAGRDIFVLTASAQASHITDFHQGQDRLDLSDWPFLYDPAAISISANSKSATLTWRDQSLTLSAASGTSFSLAGLLAAIDIDTNRAFTMPQSNIVGSAAADALTGSWGTDTLVGGAGNDTLAGGGGDDTLDGGAGQDSVIIDTRFDTASITFSASGILQITSSQGTDSITGVETFIFNDRTLTLDALLSQMSQEIYGSNASERLEGGDKDDLVMGGAGNDTLLGNTGNDTLSGGTGDDSILGGAGDDSLTGEEGQDLLSGGDGNDTLLGAGGHDTLSGGTGNDSLAGGEDNDQLWGQDGNDTLLGGAGNDRLDGGTGDDSLSGEAGNDTLSASAGNNLLSGGEGNDSLTGGTGRDTLSGGSGNDTLRGGDGSDSLTGDSGVDILFGQAGDDTLNGGADNDTLYGETGNDSLLGDAGNDRLFGQDGHDTLDGGAGNDWLQGDTGNDLLTGGSGNDVLLGISGQNTLLGGEGDDSLLGGSLSDTLRGDAGRDTLKGGSGDDTLAGGDDNDWLSGEAGDDSLTGDAGNDTLWGSAGDDTLWGGDNDDQLFGNAGADSLRGGTGRDTLKGGGADDRLFGEEGHDVLKGQKGDDIVSGGADNDVLRGNKGNDALFGDSGDDLVVGGGGNDMLNGGSGDDTVKGGGGADVFVFDEGGDKDVFRSFGKGNDSLLIDESLWGNARSAEELISEYAKVTGRGVTFDFGNGDKFLLAGYDDLWSLTDHIFMG